MPMNNRLLRPRKTPGLLDLVPGAAAAYSLRSLSNSYADPVVTVRRSSDDAEEDFTAAEVADGTLAAFCGAGDGFVKQWWDQSGNARHASQATTNAQPQIVDTGVVILEDGKPALRFDNSNDTLVLASTVAFTGEFSFYSVQRETGARLVAFGGTVVAGGDGSFFGTSSGSFVLVRNTSDAGLTVSGVDVSQRLLLAAVRSGTGTNQTAAFLNGASLATGTMAGTFNLRQVGARLTAQVSGGTLSEAIAYAESHSPSTRQLLEGNIAWGWSV